MASKSSHWRSLGFAALFICCAATYPSGGCCAQVQVPAKLSLADAVSAALAANANLKKAEQDRTNSLSQARIARIATTLDVGTSTSIEHSPIAQTNSRRAFGSLTFQGLQGTVASFDVSPFAVGSDQSGMTFDLRHPLMKGKGALSAKSDQVLAARSSAVISAKELYLTTQATVIGVVEAYYRAVLAREQITVQERALEISQQAADGASKRADAGLVAPIEVSRAEIRVTQTQNQLNIVKQEARGAIDRLMVAIGCGVGQTPELTDAVPEVTVEPPPLADAIKTALQNRAELNIQDVNLSEQARKLAIARDKIRPGLDAVANFNSSGQDTGAISGSTFDQSFYVAGLEYRVPLDKRSLVEQRDIAERDLGTLEQMRAYRMEQIAEDVLSAHRAVATSRTSLQILTQNKQTADENMRQAQLMVDEGLASNREVLDAQDALTSAESGILSAKTDLYLAVVNLKQAMGEDLTYIAQPMK